MTQPEAPRRAALSHGDLNGAPLGGRCFAHGVDMHCTDSSHKVIAGRMVGELSFQDVSQEPPAGQASHLASRGISNCTYR